MDRNESLAGDDEPGGPSGSGRPWLTIVVAVWNRERTIARCLDSIFAQNCTDYEIVAVDDGSTDRSVAIMEGYSDPRLRIFGHETNRGKNPARSTAVASARGSWILQLDSDDALLPGALETIMELSRSAPDDVGVVGMTFQYDTGGTTPEPPYPEGDVGFEQWLAWLDGAKRVDFLSCRRREVFDDVPMPGDGRGSTQMMLRTAARWKFRVDRRPGAMVYSDAGNRLCDNKIAMLTAREKEAHAIMTEEVLAEFGPILRRHAPRRYANCLHSAGRWQILCRRYRRGAGYLVRFLLRRPFSPYAWVFLIGGIFGPDLVLWIREQVLRRGPAGAHRPASG